MQYYNASMYDSLIHLHNVTTGSCKSYQFEDKDQTEFEELMRGYFVMKDVDGKKVKYFIEEDDYKKLPIRVIKSDEIFFKESARCKSIVVYPTRTDTFRITPFQCWDSNHIFINELAPFQHSEPDYWTLNKIVAIMGYVGKTFCGVCSAPEFGKSSIYLILDALTKKCPVFQPRSTPGVLAQITSDGNMVFDDIHAVLNDVRKQIENFAFHVASNAPVYINGAIKSQNTKPKYDVAHQSISFLYNIYSNYSDSDKQFWDNLWDGKDAIISRFLRMKFKGKLEEQFTKDFDIPKTADDNKMFYINMAKHLLYLKQLKLNNTYQRRFKGNNLSLEGRHKTIYDEITWGIDLYSDSQETYDRIIGVLNDSISDYKIMIGEKAPNMIKLSPNNKQASLVTEEPIKDDADRILDYLGTVVKAEPEEISKKLNIKDIDNSLLELLRAGDIFEVSPGFYKKL